MKEATGELSMTVVVIIAIVAIIGILTLFLMPMANNFIREKWSEMEGKAAYVEVVEDAYNM